MTPPRACLAFAALLACAACTGPQKPAADQPLRARLKASPAPDVAALGGAWLGVERPLRLHDELAGRVVLLAFLTPSSISCTQVLPTITALEARFSNRPFTVVGVATSRFDAERDASTIDAAGAREGVDFPVVMDADFAIWAAFGANGWPTLALIDAEGFVVAMEGGEPDPRQLETAIANLLDDGERRGVLASTAAWQARARPALPPTLAFPTGLVAVDGGFAVSDSGHHRVLVFAADGTLRHAIGTGLRGLRDGPLDEAAFAAPQGLAARGSTLFVADSGNHVIREVDLAAGRVTTVAGTGALGRGRRELTGPARSTPLRSPWGLALAGDALFIAMAGSNQVWRLDLTARAIGPWLGTGEEGFSDGADAKLARPSGVALDGDGLLIADSGASAVRRATLADKTLTTLAGVGLFTFGDADGPRADARLQYPLAVAPLDGAVFVADTYNGKVRRIKDGLVTTAAQGLSRPQGLAAVDGRLLAADTDAHRLVWVAPDTGALEPVALTGVPLPASGPVLPSVALPHVTVPSGASTVRLAVPAPKGASFAADAPQEATAVARGVALGAQPSVHLEGEQAVVEVPLMTGGAGHLSVTVRLYARPEGARYTRVGRATFEVDVTPGGTKAVVTVPARLDEGVN